jgi:hypothetical protein
MSLFAIFLTTINHFEKSVKKTKVKIFVGLFFGICIFFVFNLKENGNAQQQTIECKLWKK